MKNGVLTGHLVNPRTLSQSDETAWREFLKPTPLAFLSHGFVLAVASCNPLVKVCRISRGDKVVAFFPFQYRSHFHAQLGIGERIGDDLSDYFGIVAEPEFRIEPKLLLRLCGLKSLSFSHLSEEQDIIAAEMGDREIGYRIDLPNGGLAFWQEKGRSDKKFAADTERRERKLAREFGPLSFQMFEPDASAALEKLIAEKRGQYNKTGVMDVLSDGKKRTILQTLCHAQDAQCTGVISTLQAGATWVASHFGLKCGSTLHYWFPVYNPSLKPFAPGRILLKQIIISADIFGISRIDRGAGDSVAKRDFATSHHFFRSGLWQRPGITAAAHRIGLAIDWRVARYLNRYDAGAGAD